MADPKPQVIEVRVAELSHLFNALDPSPFREKDLAPAIEEFIVSWSRDFPAGAPFELRVHLDRAPERPDEVALLEEAVHAFFYNRAGFSRRRLRHLFREGRTSLLIGLTFLAALLAATRLIGAVLEGSGPGAILQESLLIGGWVAMWRPLEIFLYEWWPIRAETRLFDRLALMPVSIQSAATPAVSGSPTARRD